MDSKLNGIPEESLQQSVKTQTIEDIIKMLTDMLNNEESTSDYININRTANAVNITADVNSKFTSYTI
jgi:hypothetical protein